MTELEQLKIEYRSNLPLKISEVQKCIDRVIHALGMSTDPSWHELERMVHSLAGSSGTYGFMELSDAAGELEDQISSGGLQKLPPQEAARALLQWLPRFLEISRVSSTNTDKAA